MKKPLLSLFIAAASVVTAQAQMTMQIIDGWAGIANGQTYDVWDEITTTVMNFDIDAKNIGTSTKKYMMKREEMSTVPGSDNYFCWAQCYAPVVTVSLESYSIAANGTFDLP